MARLKGMNRTGLVTDDIRRDRSEGEVAVRGGLEVGFQIHGCSLNESVLDKDIQRVRHGIPTNIAGFWGSNCVFLNHKFVPNNPRLENQTSSICQYSHQLDPYGALR